MPHRSNQRWIEAHHTAGFITRVWVWTLGLVAALCAFFAFIWYAIPAFFFWLIFSVLLGG